MKKDSTTLLTVHSLIKGEHTLLVRSNPTDPIFAELNRATCNQLELLLSLPAKSNERAPFQFTVVRTAFGNIPLLAFSVTPTTDAPPFAKIFSQLGIKKLAFSESNLGTALEAVKNATKGLSEVEVWSAI